MVDQTNPPIAGFGMVPVTQALQKTDTRKPIDTNKYKDLLQAFHGVAYPKGSPDDQTGLQWENIEGEVMGAVLTQDIISGTPFLQIEDDLFTFATPQECIDKLINDKIIEYIKENRYLMPSISVMKQNLNRLMISYNREGRKELVQMIQALNLSLSEQERNDPLNKALKRI